MDYTKLIPEIKDSEKIAFAFDFARKYHKGQTRIGADGKVPYFEEHVLGVYKILKNECDVTDVDVLTVALLHDTVEDTACTFKDLEDAFGRDIMYKVKLLSKKKGEPFAEYAERLFKGASDDVLLVKLADRLHNMRTIVYMSDAKWIDRKLRQTYTDILDPLKKFPLNKKGPCYDKILLLVGKIKSQLLFVQMDLDKRKAIESQ